MHPATASVCNFSILFRITTPKIKHVSIPCRNAEAFVGWQTASADEEFKVKCRKQTVNKKKRRELKCESMIVGMVSSAALRVAKMVVTSAREEIRLGCTVKGTGR